MELKERKTGEISQKQELNYGSTENTTTVTVDLADGQEIRNILVFGIGNCYLDGWSVNSFPITFSLQGSTITFHIEHGWKVAGNSYHDIGFGFKYSYEIWEPKSTPSETDSCYLLEDGYFYVKGCLVDERLRARNGKIGGWEFDQNTIEGPQLQTTEDLGLFGTRTKTQKISFTTENLRFLDQEHYTFPSGEHDFSRGYSLYSSASWGSVISAAQWWATAARTFERTSDTVTKTISPVTGWIAYDTGEGKRESMLFIQGVAVYVLASDVSKKMSADGLYLGYGWVPSDQE